MGAMITISRWLGCHRDSKGYQFERRIIKRRRANRIARKSRAVNRRNRG